MGDRRGLYRVDKPEGKRQVERPRNRRRNLGGRRTRIIWLWIRTRGGLV